MPNASLPIPDEASESVYADCDAWRRPIYGANAAAIPCSRRPWCTRRTCAFSTETFNGATRATSSASSRRSCGASSSITVAVATQPNAAGASIRSFEQAVLPDIQRAADVMPGRGARRARGTRSAAGTHRRAAVFLRPQHRRDRGRHRPSRLHGQARVEHREGVARART